MHKNSPVNLSAFWTVFHQFLGPLKFLGVDPKKTPYLTYVCFWCVLGGVQSYQKPQVPGLWMWGVKAGKGIFLKIGSLFVKENKATNFLTDSLSLNKSNKAGIFFLGKNDVVVHLLAIQNQSKGCRKKNHVHDILPNKKVHEVQFEIWPPPGNMSMNPYVSTQSQ